MFYQSLVSDWNHGNAHFLRGVTTELLSRGHKVRVYEPADSWSYANLVAEEHGEASCMFRAAYPWLESRRYELDALDLDAALDGADVVMVHEWNERALVERVGVHRLRQGGRYRLFFHDTHHRSFTEPWEMARYDLSGYDGLLAFGESVRSLYMERGWADRAWTWHEAADTRVFYPMDRVKEGDLVWIGNWGDGERDRELTEYLLSPVRALGLRACAHGVRYPAEALRTLEASGFEYRGWLPNFEVPRTLAAFMCTVHVPRGPYAGALPGIPTIRVFEALACGVPLLSAPWEDSEGLFTPGCDFLVARSGARMKELLRDLLSDASLRASLSANGLSSVLSRHTCANRVDELLEICAQLKGGEETSYGTWP